MPVDGERERGREVEGGTVVVRDSEKYCVPTSSRRLERTSSEPASSMGCTIFTLNCSALADNEPRNAVKCDAAHCRYCCDPTIADPTVTTPRVLHAPVATSQYRHIIGVCKPANSTAVRTKATHRDCTTASTTTQAHGCKRTGETIPPVTVTRVRFGQTHSSQ